MALYSNVINLPYVDAGMTDMRQPMTTPLLIHCPKFEFDTSNFENECLFKSEYSLGEGTKCDNFVARINRYAKQGVSLWTTLDMIKRWPYSHDGGTATIYTHSSRKYGDLMHTGPWPLDEGDFIYVLPPLEVESFIDRNNAHVSNYKLHNNSTEIYTHPMILSETQFMEFWREYLLIKDQGIHRARNVIRLPTSALGRILGTLRINQLEFIAMMQLLKPVGMVAHKTGISGYDNKVNVGDMMTIKWANR